jgi:hypothetical protein
MKKLFSAIILLMLISPTLAATNDFTADGNITVSGVTFGVGTADMLILNTSTAESWSFSSGTFTVTNPGTFKVGSSDSAVKSIKITQGATNVACAENTAPVTSYVTLPVASGTYTIVPSTSTDCTSLCTALDNAATYNVFPTCGAATCNTNYEVSGSGATATCVASTCPTLSHAATYNAYPTCGAATCSSGYTISGSGASATCVAASGTLIIPVVPPPITPPTEPAVGDTQGDTTAPTPTTGGTTNNAPTTVEQILTEAKIVDLADVNKIAVEASATRDIKVESNYDKILIAKILSVTELAQLKSEDRASLSGFISYGTKSTKILGASERAGVVNSFKAAFGKLPIKESDWSDVIKIANGRWPTQRNIRAEERANTNFKIIYKRTPNRKNPKDDAAITIMAYGLRPAARNLNSEKAATKSFKAIYGYNPIKATAWDAVRTIAYSGAKR